MNNLAFLAVLLASPAWSAPRVAVVIDDFGLDYKKTPPDEEWMALPEKLTFAVMPESPRTRKSAELTEKAVHKELIIHYPFDKFQKLVFRPDAVDPGDLEKVTALLEKARKQIPNAKGLNNHQSYKGTMNRPLMKAFMALLKPTGLYFLDSKVSQKTVAFEEARAAGVKSAINTVFLDTAELHTQLFCARMLRQAVAHARLKGEAIAIGHHYFRTTFDCLKEEMPKHASEGVEFVLASALAR